VGLAARAGRKSPQTLKSYGDGVRLFLRWSEANEETPAVDRRLLARSLMHLGRKTLDHTTSLRRDTIG
jgi:hypothetical protein